MFYVSKILNDNEVIVNDTTDRSSEVVSLSDLEKLDEMCVKVYGYSKKGLERFDSEDAILAKYSAVTRMAGLPFELSCRDTGLRIDVIVGKSDLSLLKIPDYITEIGLHKSNLGFCDAFKNLRVVKASKYLRALGTRTFEKCSKLESVDLSGVVDIWTSCFSYCELLREINIGSNIEFIGAAAFVGCKSLDTLVIDSINLREIDTCAFQYSGLSHVDFSKCNLKVMPQECFRGCVNLHTVLLPDCCEEICKWCFAGCLSLKGISMPSSLIHLGESAFENTGLETIDLGNCVNLGSIKIHAFRGCEALIDVELPLNRVIIGFEAFKDCRHLRDVIGITRDNFIDTGAFVGCKNLRRVWL